jgi:hypothetical protein
MLRRMGLFLPFWRRGISSITTWLIQASGGVRSGRFFSALRDSYDDWLFTNGYCNCAHAGQAAVNNVDSILRYPVV